MNLREIESRSIRDFIERHQEKIGGRVLDFGSGKQPYRDLVIKAGGEYVPWDDPRFPGATVDEEHRIPIGAFDTVICTQVLQYVDQPVTVLEHIKGFLKRDGWLLLTGPTNWPVVEEDDKWRFTVTGIALLLLRAGYVKTEVSPRAAVSFQGEEWSLGWQAVGRA